MRIVSLLVCAVFVGGVAGCSNGLKPGTCQYTYECETGSVCQQGTCIAVSEVLDAGTTTVDAGASSDAGSMQVDAGVDAGTVNDAGVPDAGVRMAFAPGTYRRCRDDLECAVFGGNCVVELALSRPTASGVDRVKVSDIDHSFAAGEGVCTMPCTSDPRLCDSMTVTSPAGASASFTCQVVYAGPSPYPSPAPAFPFDGRLDAVAMARGVPYASVCRPPFEHALTHSEQFCQPCTQDMQCGANGACFVEHAAATPASGSCVERCTQASDCQFGFACTALPGSSSGVTYCLPSAGTCGRCRDSDLDLRGVGRCGALTEPNTAVDCDDSNAIAYFDPNDPGHAFPQVCGASDVNCNGKSDDVEQFGSQAHCGACGDVCVPRVGEIANARRACLPRGSGFSCVAECDTGYADCDQDVRTGCEQQLGSNSIYAADTDSDGRGSPSNFQYVCSGTAPAGWVQNRLDCDDTNPTIFGGSSTLPAAPELCDGLDNNCNGIPDDVGFVVDEGTTCNTGVPGVCAAGTKHCVTVAATPDAGASGHFACVGVRDPATQTKVAESCDGLDNNCNGQTDEDLDYFEANGQTNPRGRGAPAPCPVANGKGICAQGVFACTTTTSPLIDGGVLIGGTWSCQPTLPESNDLIDDDGIDSNCDGSDGNLATAVFVRPVAGGGSLDGKDSNDGSAQRPVATVQRALALACAGGAPCRDIYIEAKPFASTAAIEIPTFGTTGSTIPVRLYGGFNANVVCSASACDLVWSRGTDPTTLVRDAAARGSGSRPFGTAYAAMQAAPGTGGLSVLLDQVHLEVHAPSAGSFLQNGEHAPTQLGFVCPSRGCGAVTFRNVAIDVEGGMSGGDGAIGTAGPVASVNGGDGCGTSSNCSGVSVSDWMQYPADNYSAAISLMLNDSLPGRAAAGCPDGAQNNGGSSAAIRYQPSGGGNRQYLFDGLWGSGPGGGNGGRCWDSRNGVNPQQPYVVPGRGSNGSAGTGARYVGAYNFRLLASGASWSPTSSLSLIGSIYGRSGSGGGGGGGCIYHPDYFGCPAGEERGGGGGAGGCGGFAGGSGGEGGNAIGIVFSTADGMSLTFTTSGSFLVTVGSGGKGGNGGRGGASAAGGYGGQTPGRNGYLQGGHGGDGGGGGGGAGGLGGSSIGIFRQCGQTGGTLSNGCGMNVPPALLAAPGQFVHIGTAGVAGQSGAGGAFTAKAPDFNGRTDSSTPAPGTPGQAGFDGFAQTLFFNN